MENLPLLKDLVLLMAFAVPISILLTRLGLPIIIGFLFTGVVIGPYGLALITELKTVETIAQIGAVLLLFTIGLEFSLARMLNIRREGVFGGGLQVGLTTLAIFAISALVFKMPPGVSLLIGLVISLSSTAIVLKLLIDKGEINSAHGNLSVGVLLFQDICVVPMVIVINELGAGTADTFKVAKGLGLTIAAFILIFAAVVFIIPRVFNQVVRLRSREVFILTTVLVCIGTAWVSSLFGMSLALGAFIAGIAISESEYSNQIVAEVIPFRDTFSSLFFISIGMLLDLSFFSANIIWVLLIVAGIVLIKAIVLAGVSLMLRYPMRLSIVVGLNLAQVGEFSFILINMGLGFSILQQEVYQIILAAAIVSMALSAFLNRWSNHAALFITRAIGRPTRQSSPHEAFKKTRLTNHVIVVGYGLNGENLARVLKETEIPHLILDANMERIRTAKSRGHRAYYGDASHPEILKGMGLDSAKMLVVAISDPVAARGIVKEARKEAPHLSILVRTRYTREVEELYRLGANQVIPEEFETSVEIFARVLRDYRVPGNIIQNQIDLIREEGYAMLRSPSISGEKMHRLTGILEKGLMDTYYISEDCAVAGHTLKGLDLRKKAGATVIAVIRGALVRTNPGAEFMIEKGDTLVLIGSHAELHSAFELLKNGCPVDSRDA